MKTLDTLTKQEVQEQYKLSRAFIKRHSKDMGGIGKPLVFDRELVELFLRERMWADRRKKEEADERARKTAAELGRLVRRATNVVAPIGEAWEIRGRGGKGKVA